MKDKIFGVLQRVGRSFMLPIAILPVAGLLLGLGSSFTNATTIATYGLQGILGEGTILHSLLIIMNKVGSAIFDNLPLIFAVGVAIGMAKKEKESVKRLDHQAIQKISGNKVKQELKIRIGIESELAKKIVKLVKDSKIKVQASIQGDTVRVSGAKRDELQACIAAVTKAITDFPIKYGNFRD